MNKMMHALPSGLGHHRKAETCLNKSEIKIHTWKRHS